MFITWNLTLALALTLPLSWAYSMVRVRVMTLGFGCPESRIFFFKFGQTTVKLNRDIFKQHYCLLSVHKWMIVQPK